MISTSFSPLFPVEKRGYASCAGRPGRRGTFSRENKTGALASWHRPKREAPQAPRWTVNAPARTVNLATRRKLGWGLNLVGNRAAAPYERAADRQIYSPQIYVPSASSESPSSPSATSCQWRESLLNRYHHLVQVFPHFLAGQERMF